MTRERDPRAHLLGQLPTLTRSEAREVLAALAAKAAAKRAGLEVVIEAVVRPRANADNHLTKDVC